MNQICNWEGGGESITYAIIKDFFLLKNICKQLNTIETQYFNVETQMGKTTKYFCIDNFYKSQHQLTGMHQHPLSPTPTNMKHQLPFSSVSTNWLWVHPHSDWLAPTGSEGNNLLFMSAPTDKEATTSLRKHQLAQAPPFLLVNIQ